MTKNTITVHGISVDTLDKTELIEIIEGMIEDQSNRYKKAKTNAVKRSEKAAIRFFGSIVEHLKAPASTVNVNINKLVDKIDIRTLGGSDTKEQLTKMLNDIINSSQLLD